MISFFTNKEDKQSVLNFENPFKSDRVTNIEFAIGKAMFKPHEWQFKSNITFRTDSTTVYHQIKGTSFKDIVDKTEEFIKAL